MVTTVYRGVDGGVLGERCYTRQQMRMQAELWLDCQESITVSDEGRGLASKALSVGLEGRWVARIGLRY